MGKATIIEAQNSNTEFEGSKQSGILGKLKGIFADYKHGTRNADRLYSEELWDKKVFGSEDVMEALRTKTLFGELDHPEGDRCETYAKNAAVTITKLEKRPDEGVIYGEAEILDTPTGRIVKALADSGAKLGVSSRGLGEEIFENGQNIIDPDTYDFITFDVVVTPANEKARVQLTESKHIYKLSESLQTEINKCETTNQLNQVKKVVESLNIGNKSKMLETIDQKLKEKETKKPEIKLETRKQELVTKLLRERLETKTEQLQESLKANEQLSIENNKLIEQKEFLEESRNTLKTKIKESIDKTVTEEAHNKVLEENKEFKKDLEESMKLLQRQENKTQVALQKQRALYENKITTLEKEIATLKENITIAKQTNTKLQEEKAELLKTQESNSKILIESKKTIDELNKTIEKLNNNAKLTESKVKASKLEESKKIQQLTARVKQLEESNNNFANLSFNPLGSFTKINEDFDITQDMDEEDRALFEVLTHKK